MYQLNFVSYSLFPAGGVTNRIPSLRILFHCLFCLCLCLISTFLRSRKGNRVQVLARYSPGKADSPRFRVAREHLYPLLGRRTFSSLFTLFPCSLPPVSSSNTYFVLLIMFWFGIRTHKVIICFVSCNNYSFFDFYTQYLDYIP